MAKNTGSSAFRRVDVDQFSEEKYEEEAVAEDEANGPNEADIQRILNEGRNFDALLHALNTAPLSTKNQLVKERVVQTVLKVLLTFKSNEIDVAVKSLDQPQLDLLMKYIYRGFEYPSDGSSAQLLTWHEKVFSVGGLGCIIRVLTDRKRV